MQKNVLAFLAGAFHYEELAKQIVADKMVSQLVNLLGGKPEDEGMQVNLVAAITAACEASAQGCLEVVQGGGLKSLLALCDDGQTALLQETALDALCTICSYRPEHRGIVVSEGVVPILAALLSSPSMEVTVRSLVCLGMVVPPSSTAQEQLVDEEGAVLQLVSLMRQQDDLDCRIIARDLMGVITKDEKLRVRVQEKLRNQQAKS